MDEAAVQQALDDILDEAVVFHGFTDYMRDYDVYVYVDPSAEPVSEKPQLRYRFRNCVEANVRSTLAPDVWAVSTEDELLRPPDQQEGPPSGYLWGVRWHELYPGGCVVSDSPSAARWTGLTGMQFMAVTIETNAHEIDLVFTDLHIEEVDWGTVPFEVTPDT